MNKLICLFVTQIIVVMLPQQAISKPASLLASFESQECKPKERRKFEELLKNYRAEGYFVPEKAPGILDREALLAVEELQRQKLKFLDTQIANIKKPKTYKILKEKLRNSEAALARFFDELKTEFLSTSRGSNSPSSQPISNEKLRLELVKELKSAFLDFLEAAPYLRSFQAPVDHLVHRKKDAQLKGSSDWGSYFLRRKILEDGTYGKNKTRPDLFLRSTLDTLEITLNSKNFEKSFVQDFEFRRRVLADLQFAHEEVDQILARPKSDQITRLIDWKKRTIETFDFYQELGSDRQPSSLSEHQLRWQRQSRARWELIEFVMKKQVALYEAISKLPLKEQKVLVLEKILFNEVPQMGSTTIDEKKEVAGVVMNRSVHPVYAQLGPQDRLVDYLLKSGKSEPELKKSAWANVLFKEGEFSFTYFYMPGVYDLFCHNSKKDREIAESVVEEEEKPGAKGLSHRAEGAIRYYSRSAMVGRVEMEAVWNDHEVIYTQIGHPVESSIRRSLDRLFAEEGGAFPLANAIAAFSPQPNAKKKTRSRGKHWAYWGYSPTAKKHLVEWRGGFYWFDSTVLPGESDEKSGTPGRWNYFRDPDRFRYLKSKLGRNSKA